MEQWEKVCEALHKFTNTLRARISRVADSRPNNDVAELELQSAKFNGRAQARVESCSVYIKTLK
eukprot:4286436-Lingulodinium_polyedra.AAC.1